MKKRMSAVINSTVLACSIGLLSIYSSAVAATELLKDGYPQRYVVKKGDTLWDLAATYLNEPWRWKEIWQANQEIENPDLIYPGDLLVLTMVDGSPVLRALQSQKLNDGPRETIKLRPKIRSTDYVASIPPISPRAMKPFLESPLVTTDREIQTAAYIVEGVNSRLIGGKNEEMYAKGIANTQESEYQIFRAGRELIHPVTKEALGYEAIDIGRAKLVRAGEPAKLKIISSNGVGVLAGDFLREVDAGASLPFFFPSENPNKGTSGSIIPAATRASELGKLDMVAVAFNPSANVMPGQVFKVLSKSYMKKDPVKEKEFVTIPSEQIGLLMIVRSFDRVSYGIITDASRAINGGDLVVNPSE